MDTHICIQCRRRECMCQRWKGLQTQCSLIQLACINMCMHSSSSSSSNCLHSSCHQPMDLAICL
uniref:Uncharacterized protein n=1 Tax=Arundo donax TaxID=35708 RepID=A0A0A9CNC3_ARUDO